MFVTDLAIARFKREYKITNADATMTFTLRTSLTWGKSALELSRLQFPPQLGIFLNINRRVKEKKKLEVFNSMRNSLFTVSRALLNSPIKSAGRYAIATINI